VATSRPTCWGAPEMCGGTWGSGVIAVAGVKEAGWGPTENGAQICFLPLPNCVTLSKVFNVPKPQVPLCKTGR
jgi:hypothetical protein